MKSITLSLLLVAVTATAAPAPTLSVVEVERDQIGDMMTPELTAAEDEPGGMLVTAASDQAWFAIGFRVGDVIRYIDGLPATTRIMLRDGMNLLEIDRDGRKLLFRVLVHGPAVEKKHLSPSDFEDLEDRLAKPEPRSTVVRRRNAPSGVRVTDFLIELQLDIEIGDIVRTIDGKPIRSDAALVSALRNLKIGLTRIQLERHRRPVTLEVTRDAPLDLSQIKRVSATRYEIPRALVDIVQDDLFVATRKLEAVAVVAKNTVRGVRIYNLKPDAPAAAVGLENDDLILDVDGHAIATISDAVRALRAIAGASQVTLHVERNGKPLAFTYVVR